MDKISNFLNFFVNIACRPVVLTFQMHFCDINYSLNNFLAIA